jgi:hypothetical protein
MLSLDVGLPPHENATEIATGQQGITRNEMDRRRGKGAGFRSEIKTVWNLTALGGTECNELLNRYTVISRIVGSNPIPSAT